MNLIFVGGGADINQGTTVIQTTRNGHSIIGENEKTSEKRAEGGEKEKEKTDSASETISATSVYLKKISFDPRVVGPLAIIGPARGAFGQPLKMAHIASSNNIRNSSASPTLSTPTGNVGGGGGSTGNASSNPKGGAKPAPQMKNPKGKTPDAPSGGGIGGGGSGGGGGNAKPFHFATWNDDGEGEYCLWTIIANRREKETIQYEWFPRLLFPKVKDRDWLEVRLCHFFLCSYSLFFILYSLFFVLLFSIFFFFLIN